MKELAIRTVLAMASLVNVGFVVLLAVTLMRLMWLAMGELKLEQPAYEFLMVTLFAGGIIGVLLLQIGSLLGCWRAMAARRPSLALIWAAVQITLPLILGIVVQSDWVEPD